MGEMLITQHGLSRMQSEIAHMLAQGLILSDIAAALHVSEKAVKYHLTVIYKKLKINDEYGKRLKRQTLVDFVRLQNALPGGAKGCLKIVGL